MKTKNKDPTDKKKKKCFDPTECKVGDSIYVPTSLYLSHGEDDFDGGLCKIIEIGKDSGWKWIKVQENPTNQYSYDYLLEGQKEWKKEYGKRRGKRSPDYSPQFNCWAAPGDIVDGKVIDHYIY